MTDNENNLAKDINVPHKEQMIIDGIDISGCEFYNKDDKTCREVNGKYDTDICEFDKCENSNCCYKQLKRKEQECQQAMDNYVQLDLQRVKEYNELVDLYKAKERECEKYKQTIAKIKDICSEMNCESLVQNSWCGNTDFKMGCCEKLLKRQLLQKLSEVDNEK